MKVPLPTTTGPTIPGTKETWATPVIRPIRGRRDISSSTRTTKRGVTHTAMKSTIPLETNRKYKQRVVAERHHTAPWVRRQRVSNCIISKIMLEISFAFIYD